MAILDSQMLMAARMCPVAAWLAFATPYELDYNILVGHRDISS